MYLKEIIKKNRLLRKLIIPFLGIPYKLHFILNKPFKYKLLKGGGLKIFPKGQIAQGIYEGGFEKQEIFLFQKLLKPGMVIVDAGSNIGLYSLIAANEVGSNGRVFAFEPSKETFQRLLKNINLNGFTNIVSLNLGLGDKINEKLILHQDIGYEDAERYLLPNNEGHGDKLENTSKVSKLEKVSIDTLDNCLSKQRCKKVDIIKIDTEGFEYYVLRGAKNILYNNPKILILMECTASGTSRASTTQNEVFSFLKGFGLNIFYWNSSLNAFCDDEKETLNAGVVWVCKDKSQLGL